jgi:hypothetical protein
MNPHLIHFIVIIPFVQAACSTSRRTTRISAVCEDQYSSTLAMREETADEAFKVTVYMTRKAQGWFRGWGCPRRPLARPTRPPPPAPRRRGERRWGCDANASPGTDSVGRRGCIRPHCRPNAGEGGGDDQAPSPTVDLETLPPGPWALGTCHPSLQDFSPFLSSAKLA